MDTPAATPALQADPTIPLPQWITASRLSLAEIGALACVLASGTKGGGFAELFNLRMKSADLRNAMNGLRAKKVLTFKNHREDTTKPWVTTWTFNLDAVFPE